MKITKDDTNEKWGEQRHSDEKWLAIILEELGEPLKPSLKNEEGILEETVQVAALLQAWVT